MIDSSVFAANALGQIRRTPLRPILRRTAYRLLAIARRTNDGVAQLSLEALIVLCDVKTTHELRAQRTVELQLKLLTQAGILAARLGKWPLLLTEIRFVAWPEEGR